MLSKRILVLVFVLAFLTLLFGCLPAPPNQAPVITSTPVTTAKVGETYTYNVDATDPDVGDTLAYTLDIKPTNMSISSTTGLINWIPAVPGTFNVVVKVSDGDLDITQSFKITVIEEEEPSPTPTPTINHAPIITSSPIIKAVKGVAYLYDVDATDPDGDALTYSLTTKPSGMGINFANGVIDWIPTAEGAFAVEVKVSDGNKSDTQNFTITVKTVEITKIVVLPETMTLVTQQGSETIQSVTAHYDIKSDFEVPIPLGDCTYGSDPPVATVSNDGVITAGLIGTATITVSYAGMTDTVEVTVVLPVHNITQNLYYMLIQDAVDGANPNDIIEVAGGTYAPFVVDGKNDLTIKSNSTVIVQGTQPVTTAYGDRDCVVFIKDSDNIILDDLDIEGLGLGSINTKNYGIIYENSSGEINNCTVAPNTVGNMYSTAIGVWDNSNLTIDNCTIWNFGRIGVLVYNNCTANILNNTVIGTQYSGEGKVCYGIEVEANGSGASQATITGNNIYNCDNTFSPAPTWESSGIYINGWLELQPEADCMVIVEDNDIHDNYIGIIVIKSLLSYAHYNNIHDNRVFGVDCLPAHDATTAVFDATNNWWGSEFGATHDGFPLNGGDTVSDNVDYSNWSIVPN